MIFRYLDPEGRRGSHSDEAGRLASAAHMAEHIRRPSSSYCSKS